MTQPEHSSNQIKLSEAKAGSPEETFARICRFSLLRPRAVVLRLSPRDCAQIQQRKAWAGEQYCSLSTAQGRRSPATLLLLLCVNIGAWFEAATSATTCKLPSFSKPENHAESIGHPQLHSNPHRCAGRRYPGIVLCRRNPATGRGAGVSSWSVPSSQILG